MDEPGTTETINLSAFEYFTPRRLSEALFQSSFDLLGENTCPGMLKGTEIPKLALVLVVGPNTQRGKNIVRRRDLRRRSSSRKSFKPRRPIQKTGISAFILGAQSERRTVGVEHRWSWDAEAYRN